METEEKTKKSAQQEKTETESFPKAMLSRCARSSPRGPTRAVSVERRGHEAIFVHCTRDSGDTRLPRRWADESKSVRAGGARRSAGRMGRGCQRDDWEPSHRRTS